MKRKICVITGSRADYGLLRWVMQEIKNRPELTLQIIAAGAHLSIDFGSTYTEIENDGFEIDYKVAMLSGDDSEIGTIKSMSVGLIEFAKALNILKPDLIVVLGDRYEIFTAVSAALILKIPVAHIHGGEKTVGAFDEALRHSITKMSHLHFVAAEEYRNRVMQLGEKPNSVFLVGGLGIDNILKLKLLSKEELEISLGLIFQRKSLLVTFHPETLSKLDPGVQMNELLSALSELKDTTLIFTMPNADPGGNEIKKMIKKYIAITPNAHVFASLGQTRYLSTLVQVDGVIGNSSSGLLEAPSFKKATVNIGNRQEGRLQATSVINCEPTKENIANALVKLYSEEFQNKLLRTKNPYDLGGASNKIVDIVCKVELENIINKVFYDVGLKPTSIKKS